MKTTEVLKKYFGYDSFRGGQEAIIQHILAGKDVLAIMPTGAGKSICFQVPAVMNHGITLVVSPLISLMKDQVGALIQAGIPAAYFNSTLTPRQMELALSLAEQGKYKLIYVAPERLLTLSFLSFVSKVQIDMVTIDEAHCISQWGQDFRPGYLQIPQFIASLPQRPVVSAFTATATLQVKEDIGRLLELRTPEILVTGFDRENLYFEVQSPKNKMQALVNFIHQNEGKAGIVYCATRKNVELVCETLNGQGISASRYHAGLPEVERHRNQDDFLFDRVQIMVATNAFGMGIDKSNVSFVVHYNMPKDIESYYQEAGRAGRDGTPAKCLLLYSGQDVRTNQWMIENGKDTAQPDDEMDKQRKERDYNRLKQMTFYATSSNCLRGFILKYFGERVQVCCGHCGNCDTKFETVDITQEAQKILSCVHRLGGRFGTTMVINVLRGSKNERIEQLGLNALSTYGISNQSVDTLRTIIEHLVHMEYLEKTEEQYAVLRLTQTSCDILHARVQLALKLPQEKAPKASASSETSRQATVPPERAQVYEQLKQLRASIASEQGVPAFVIFTDRSLIDMCIRLPHTQASFLEVDGVGETKRKRYGERFLAVLRAFGSEEIARTQPEKSTSRSRVGTERKARLNPLTDDVLEKIQALPDAISIGILSGRINEVLVEKGCAAISAVKLANWLVENDFLTMELSDGGNHRVPTQAGRALGIVQHEQMGKSGAYFVNLYPEPVQQFIIQQLPQIFGDA